MPRSRSSALSYWSVPALIDWMKRSREAMSASSFRHIMETTSTSASGSCRARSSAVRTSTWAMRVLRSANRSAMR